METTLRQVLLDQLDATHDKAGWYVPVMQSLTGLTDEQSRWQEPGIEHSIAQLVQHIIYWNRLELDKFLSQPATMQEMSNNETFAQPAAGAWNGLVQQLDKIFTDWAAAIASSEDQKIAASSTVIAQINVHTAYHTGQIVYLRKRQGSWQAAHGVQ